MVCDKLIKLFILFISFVLMKLEVGTALPLLYHIFEEGSFILYLFLRLLHLFFMLLCPPKKRIANTDFDYLKRYPRFYAIFILFELSLQIVQCLLLVFGIQKISRVIRKHEREI